MTTERFERHMTSLPSDLVSYISDYAPGPKKKAIAKNSFWSRSDEQSYYGLKDQRYNELPEYQKDLALKIGSFGTFEQVKNTLDRWYSKDVDQNWDKFIINYPYGRCVNPYSIKNILKQEKWGYIGGTRLKKMRTKRRISKKHNTKKRINRKRISKK